MAAPPTLARVYIYSLGVHACQDELQYFLRTSEESYTTILRPTVVRCELLSHFLLVATAADQRDLHSLLANSTAPPACDNIASARAVLSTTHHLTARRPCPANPPICAAETVKSTGVAQALGQLQQSLGLVCILSQTAGSTEKLWANPVSFRLRARAAGGAARGSPLLPVPIGPAAKGGITDGRLPGSSRKSSKVHTRPFTPGPAVQGTWRASRARRAAFER
jgi:hypothetical protein